MRKLLLGLLLLPSCQFAEDCEETMPNAMAYYSEVKEPAPQLQKTVSYFKSCAEVMEFALEKGELANAYSINSYGGSNGNTCQTFATQNGNQQGDQLDAIADNSEGQVTNTQEKGVDESDRVKISKNYIFYTRENSVEVLDRKSKDWVRSIPVSGNWRPYIYVYNENLIVIRSHKKPFINNPQKNNQAVSADQPVYVRKPEKFDVVFYDLRSNFRELGRKIVAGNYKTSRLSSDGLLTIITNFNLTPHYQTEKNKDHLTDLLSHMDCTQMARPAVTDYDTSLTSVHSFNVKNLKPAQAHKQTHVVGSRGMTYMRDQLYLIKNHIRWFWWDERNPMGFNTQVATRLELKNDKWHVNSHFQFTGRTLGIWSFKEVGDYFYVATTDNEEPGRAFASHFNVFKKLDRSTVPVAQITGIAPGEVLRSARMNDRYAYLVTFRFIDPLFIIDLQNPESPKIVSELKIPGFSSYLHETGDDRLIGVGYAGNFSQLQLSLFDVADPKNPQALDQHVLDNNYSSSTAQHDHHAFFYNNDWDLVGLPIRATTYDSNWSHTYNFTGAHLYDLGENNFTPIGKITHKDWIESHCFDDRNQNRWTSYPGSKDVSRIHRIDDALMTFSDFGARVHDWSSPQIELKRTLFKDPEESCPRPYPVCMVL